VGQVTIGSLATFIDVVGNAGSLLMDKPKTCDDCENVNIVKHDLWQLFVKVMNLRREIEQLREENASLKHQLAGKQADENF
jgi:hypothetical protein